MLYWVRLKRRYAINAHAIVQATWDPLLAVQALCGRWLRPTSRQPLTKNPDVARCNACAARAQDVRASSAPPLAQPPAADATDRGPA